MKRIAERQRLAEQFLLERNKKRLENLEREKELVRIKRMEEQRLLDLEAKR